MSLLMRALTIVGRPVVTLGGDDLAEVKDVVFNRGEGRVVGFTLNKRGFLRGRMKEALPWETIHALGPDAVMVEGPEAFRPPAEVVDRSDAKEGNIIASRVLTDEGTDLGEVTDAVVDVHGRADLVGYEFEASDALDTRKGRTLFIPIPDALAVSGQALMVPAAALEYVRDDLAGFGEAVDAFRDRLRGAH